MEKETVVNPKKPERVKSLSGFFVGFSSIETSRLYREIEHQGISSL
jgi:hypothetical protein